MKTPSHSPNAAHHFRIIMLLALVVSTLLHVGSAVAQPMAASPEGVDAEAPQVERQLPAPDNRDWFNGNLNGVRLFADRKVRLVDPALYARLDADLSELEADRRWAWVAFGAGAGAGLGVFLYPFFTESGCRERVPATEVVDCENERAATFVVPGTLVVAAGLGVWALLKPSTGDVRRIVDKYELRQRTRLALDLDPTTRTYGGRVTVAF